MGNQRFICEVKRDFDNHTLGLVHTNRYDTKNGPEGLITFESPGELDRYFRDHCVSEKRLENASNSWMSFLVFFIVLTLIVMLMMPLFNKKSSAAAVSSFGGKFTF
jgi:hypothetical protein